MKPLAGFLSLLLVASLGFAQAEEPQDADLNALIKQLESDDARERAAACYGLGKLHEKAEPAAMKVAMLLAKDEDENVRKMAAQTLGEIAVHTQGAPGENPKVLVGVLIDALSDPEAGVRLMAAQSIGNFKKNADPATLALARVVTSDGDSRVRHAAIQSLGTIGHFGGPRSEKALPYL